MIVIVGVDNGSRVAVAVGVWVSEAERVGVFEDVWVGVAGGVRVDVLEGLGVLTLVGDRAGRDVRLATASRILGVGLYPTRPIGATPGG